jgi:hypothetical protein
MSDKGSAAEKARSDQEEVEAAKKEMERLEEGDPPERLEDWPDGKAKYQTYGRPGCAAGPVRPGRLTPPQHDAV